MEFLTEHHDVFSIDESDCGETRVAELFYWRSSAQETSCQTYAFCGETRSSQTAEENAGNWCDSAL